MRVTPLDIIQKQFATSRKGGFDPEEVKQFLEEVRESMEQLIKDNQRLRDDITRRDTEIGNLKNAEDSIKKTLLLARKLSEDLDRGARREADVIIGEARLEAERIIMAAAEERRDLQADIVHLRSNRSRLLSDLQGVLDAYTRMLDEIGRETPADR